MKRLIPLFLFGVTLLPFPALASAGITEFGGPLQTFVDTICGPAGKFIATLAIACVGVYFAMNRAEMTDTAKLGTDCGGQAVQFLRRDAVGLLCDTRRSINRCSGMILCWAGSEIPCFMRASWRSLSLSTA